MENKLKNIKKIIQKYQYHNVENLKTIKPNFLTLNIKKYYLNNGQTIIRDTLIKPTMKAAMIIPETTNNTYLMVIQPRVATKHGVTIEFPAGLINDNEDIVTGIKRELLEETGYEAHNIVKLTEYYQDTATTSSTLTLLKANNCQKIKEQKLDKDEFITYIELTMEEIDELIKEKYIVDGNSLFGITLIKNKL